MRLPVSILLALSVIIISSCTLTNRKYRPGFYIDKRVLYKVNESRGTGLVIRSKHKECFAARENKDLFATNEHFHCEQAEAKLPQPITANKSSSSLRRVNYTQFNPSLPIDTAKHEVGDKVIQKRAALSKEYGLLSLLGAIGAIGLGYLVLLILSVSFFDILLDIGFAGFLVMTILLIVDSLKNARYIRHSKWARLEDKRKATFGMIMAIISIIVMLAFSGLLAMVLTE